MVRLCPLAVVALLLPATLALSACSSSSATTAGRMRVVAGVNVWGDIARQIGGTHAQVTSIVTNPQDDPHQFEANPRDAAAVAGARVVIVNGLGYDDFMNKLLSVTRGHRTVLTVAKVLGVRGNDANPHLWYDAPHVHDVAAAIESALVAADPRDAREFAANLAAFDASLRPLLATVGTIRAGYGGAPVAYTERVAGYLVAACDLRVVSPAGFTRAIEDGNEPSARDEHAFDELVRPREVKALLFNEQATSRAASHVRDLARDAGVPVVAITETLPRREPNFQSWQLHQAQALLRALGG